MEQTVKRKIFKKKFGGTRKKQYICTTNITNNDMGIKAKIEKQLDGGFSISFEENGSGDLNKVIDDLCEKHRDDSSRQSPAEIFTEITQAVFDQGKDTVDDSKR